MHLKAYNENKYCLKYQVVRIPVKMGHLSGQSGPAVGKGWGAARGMGLF